MTKTMTKYQLDHFKQKVRRQFDPLIDDQELLVKQYKTQATDKAVAKLSKKIGADKIIKAFEDAELSYKFKNGGSSYRDDKLTLSDCKDELRQWASNLTEKEIERRPEGARLRQLKDLKQKALDTVMEAGTPDSLALALDKVSNKIGLSWNTELTALPNIKNEN